MRYCTDKIEMPECHQLGNTNIAMPVLEAKDSIQRKLTWTKKNLTCPFATKTLRDIYNHITLRNVSTEDEEDLVVLPPWASNRELWLDRVRIRGWDLIQTCKNRQKYKNKDKWTMSPGFYKTNAEAKAAAPIKLPYGTEVALRVAKNVVVFETLRRLWVREFSPLCLGQRQRYQHGLLQD